ncbi:MAG: autotransporter outer membrane beta-barrel domain-containing protein, partial [Candidatus Omnitrophica bacterium]|nr:autotransporter outer membrane beta-barrel domain-containing protein [Candidatus Omnitrophota bacterium]
NDHIKKLEDLERYDNWPNFYRIDGKVSWGQVDYDSQGTGSLDGVDDTMAEMRAVAGYDLPIFKNIEFAPYVGAGYRYLFDDLRGVTTTGAIGFRREANYVYAPIGFDIEQRLKRGWSLGVNLEYDYLFYGRQRSKLGDVDPGLNTVTNRQRDGFGLRGSFKIINVSDMWDFYFEPFVRYWNINDSDTSLIIFNGTPIGLGQEPTNNSTEYGFKVGARF